LTENPGNKYVKIEIIGGLPCIILQTDENIFAKLEKKAEKLTVIFKGIRNILSEKYTCIYAVCGNNKSIILTDKIIVCKIDGVVTVRNDPLNKLKKILINGTVNKYYREFDEIESTNKMISKRKINRVHDKEICGK
jgi:hypothetical protein